jgi:NAD+ synthase (glutamine-hydrolysing)
VRRIRVAAAQINTCVGDIDGNVALVLETYERAVAAAADLVVFPELTVTGYPPEDLLLKPAFIAEAMEATQKLAAATGDTVAVIGFPEAHHDLHNAAAVCANGAVMGVYRKQLLPNYAVFDEQRYFVPGDDPGPLHAVAGVKVGVTICEDLWSPTGPLADQAAGGAELAVNINGSPYRRGKLAARQTMLATRAADAGVPLVYCNLVGGQDELIFDGASLVFDEEGGLLARAAQFVEELLVVDIEVPQPYRERLFASRGRRHSAPLPVVELSDASTSGRAPRPARIEPELDDIAEVWSALVLGTRDYVRKNGFSDVVIGLSGGIDSSLVAAIAVDALGAEHVHGVAMPSRYSSQGSRDDAAELAANLGIDHRLIEIEPAHTALLDTLAPSFEGRQADITEENLQSRIRGVLLMALSNKFGWLVLTTGNKSEAAVGYSTLYGDTAGGFAVIKDVPKLLVYELCRHRNLVAGTDVIPRAVIEKPPSAELRPDQRDDQSLPPYEELDPILEAYIEQDRTSAELVELGFAPDLVARITRLVDLAEYKRRQNPPGPRISEKAFGKDRRLPITNAHR